MFDQDIYVKIIKLQRGRLQLESNSEDFLVYIQQQFTVKNPMAGRFQWAKDDITCISPIYSFKEGLAIDIITKIKNYSSNIKVDISEVRDIIFPLSIKEYDLIQPENTKYKFYDYQEDAIKRSMKSGRGCFILATGSGKTIIMYGILRNMFHNTDIKRVFILVPNVDLLNQMTDEFVDEYGCKREDICKYGVKKNGGTDIIGDEPIIISNRQYLDAGKRWDNLPEDIGLLLIDEVHGVSSGSLLSKNLIKLNIKTCFGFTGTESDVKASEWEMKGVIGPILKTIRAKDLQKRGVLANIKMVSVQFEHTKKFKLPPEEQELLDSSTALYRNDPSKENYVLLEKVKQEVNKVWFPLEWKHVEDCVFTNQFMLKIMYRFKGNTILLFDHIKHGKELFKYLEKINNESDNPKKIFYIDGNIKPAYRTEVRKQMEEHNNCILIGNTKCVGTGINIKNLDNIGFAFSAGKAVVKIIQSIGRGLRKKIGKTKVNMIDFNHSLTYSKRHFANRLKLYKIHYDIDICDIISKTVDVPRVKINKTDVDNL